MVNDLVKKIEEMVNSKERIVLLGIGNPLRGDDGVGAWISEQLKGKVRVPVFNGEEVPENVLFPILEENPSLVIAIDAVDFGGMPGEARLISPEEVTPSFMSSHHLSLNVLSTLLEEKNCRMVILGIQPKRIEWSEEMSDEVKKEAERIISLFSSLLG